MAIFKAKWLFRMDAPPLRDGALRVESGRIVEIGAASDILASSSPDPESRDFADAAILPGFINAHSHLDLTCYRGRLAAGPLWSWLDGLIGLRREQGASEREREAVRQGIDESLSHGVTTIGDISRYATPVEVIAASAIRAVCFQELISGARQPPNDEASLLRRLNELAPFADADRLRIGISPHAPYTVHTGDLAAVLRQVDSSAVPWTLHYLETTNEVDWLAGQSVVVSEFLARMNSSHAQAGLKMADWLSQSDWLNRRPLLAHVNYTSDAEIQRIAAAGASVVWCPRAHQFYGHRHHRWLDMLNAGVNVCIGTDSAACVPTLSILDELRFLWRQNPAIEPDHLLQLGTRGGAQALGMDRVTGTLTIGKYADFVVLPCGADDPRTAAADLLSSPDAIIEVYLNGRKIAPNPVRIG